jgi:hypothetical protein
VISPKNFSDEISFSAKNHNERMGGLDRFIQFRNWCLGHGVHLLISFPNLVEPKEAHSEEAHVASGDIVNALRSAGFEVVGTPEDAFYERKYFSDTQYHMSLEGIAIRTENLVRLLQKQGYFRKKVLASPPSSGT